MKVLEEVAPVPWTQEFECKGCKSKLKAEEEDIRARQETQTPAYASDTTYYVVCPVCSTDHYLVDNAIPWRVKKRIRRAVEESTPGEMCDRIGCRNPAIARLKLDIGGEPMKYAFCLHHIPLEKTP